MIDSDGTDIHNIELIKKAIKSRFNCKSDVIFLKLLEEEDIKLDKLAILVGLSINEDSAYKSICKDIVWYGEV